jgi:hypothetical protein
MSVEVDEGNCWYAVDIDKYSNWQTLHYIYYKKIGVRIDVKTQVQSTKILT